MRSRIRRDPQAAGTRWMLATAATTCSCSTIGRCVESTDDSADLQSIAAPSRMSDAIASRRSSLPATLHLLCQTNQRPLRGLPRRFSAGLVERLGELLVGVAELYTADDRVLFFRPQTLKGSIVAVERFLTDGLLQR